jgi:UDP-N-acetylglucosamine transferase subunit ALG13
VHNREDPYDTANGRAVLCASTGGHLAQLVRLRARLNIAADPLWMTFDHPQARSLLRGERVHYLPYIASRDYAGVRRAIRPVWRLLNDESPEVVVSTGAAVALAALPLAVAQRRRAVYIESVSRFDGPSVSGRLLLATPGVSTYTQHASWADNRWKFRGSVLEDYDVYPSERPGSDASLKVFVTLGTIKPFRFDSIVDKVRQVVPAGSDIAWQVGSTTRPDLTGKVVETVAAAEFDDLVRWSDVVISHAGVGSALRLLELGRCPVLVPRRKRRGEHVDDHQQQVARYLEGLGLAVSREVEALAWPDLLLSASRRVRS